MHSRSVTPYEMFEDTWGMFSQAKFESMDDDFLMEWQSHYAEGMFEGLIAMQTDLRAQLKLLTFSRTVGPPNLDVVEFMTTRQHLAILCNIAANLFDGYFESLFDLDAAVDRAVRQE